MAEKSSVVRRTITFGPINRLVLTSVGREQLTAQMICLEGSEEGCTALCEPEAVTREDLETLVRSQRSGACFGRLELRLTPKEAFAAVDGRPAYWSYRDAFDAGVQAFLLETRGEGKAGARTAADEVWQKVKKREPTATRAEYENGEVIRDEAPHRPGVYAIRRPAIDPKDGKTKMGTFKGRTREEALQTYYAHIRKHGKPEGWTSDAT